MGLLNTAIVQLEELIGATISEYIILLHTWGVEEVSFQDIQSGQAKSKAGYVKIIEYYKEAEENGYTYF